MNNFFRALIAGYGAKKLGGGCFGTILVFVLIWVALGQCSFSSREVPPPQTYPSKHRVHVPVSAFDKANFFFNDIAEVSWQGSHQTYTVGILTAPCEV